MARRPVINRDPKDPAAKFARKLRALRADAGVQAMTVPEAAEMGGVSPSAIYYALSGKRLPTVKVLVAMTSAWGGNEKSLLRARSQAEAEGKGYTPPNGKLLLTEEAVTHVANKLLYADELVERPGAAGEWTRSISYRGDAVYDQVRKVLEEAMALMKTE